MIFTRTYIENTRAYIDLGKNVLLTDKGALVEISDKAALVG